VILDFDEPQFPSAVLVLDRQAIVPPSIVALDILLGFVIVLASVVYPSYGIRKTDCTFSLILNGHEVVESFLYRFLRDRRGIGEVSCVILITQTERKECQMSIAADLIRGHTDAIILSHLIHRDSYGYEINKSILGRSDHRYELKEATLYTAFKRLEELGYIASYWGDSGAGARRRYYTITAAGREARHRLLGEWRETKEIMDKLLER
jgi:DNA-binding PadR family transcriptional regulator